MTFQLQWVTLVIKRVFTLSICFKLFRTRPHCIYEDQWRNVACPRMFLYLLKNPWAIHYPTKPLGLATSNYYLEYCCNLSGGVALIVWFTTNGMCAKNNTIIYVRRASNSKRDCDAWSLLLLAATVRSFAHMLLGISDRNSMLQTRKQRKKLSVVTRRFAFWKIMDKVQTHVDYWITLYMAGLLNTLPS